MGNWTFANLDCPAERRTPASYQVSAPSPTDPATGLATFRANLYSFYVQDAWQKSDRLRDHGRESVSSGLASSINRPRILRCWRTTAAARAAVPNRSTVSPRFSFNWDITGDQRNQLRGGLGYFAGTPPFVYLSNAFGNSGLSGLRRANLQRYDRESGNQRDVEHPAGLQRRQHCQPANILRAVHSGDGTDAARRHHRGQLEHRHDRSELPLSAVPEDLDGLRSPFRERARQQPRGSLHQVGIQPVLYQSRAGWSNRAERSQRPCALRGPHRARVALQTSLGDASRSSTSPTFTEITRTASPEPFRRRSSTTSRVRSPTTTCRRETLRRPPAALRAPTTGISATSPAVPRGPQSDTRQERHAASDCRDRELETEDAYRHLLHLPGQLRRTVRLRVRCRSWFGLGRRKRRRPESERSHIRADGMRTIRPRSCSRASTESHLGSTPAQQLLPQRRPTRSTDSSTALPA